MASLIVTAHADRDLDDILNYLTGVAGRRSADAYGERFAASLERIARFPGAGPQRPALGVDTRITLVLPYVIIYDYDARNDEAVVLRVLHGRRRITERLLVR